VKSSTTDPPIQAAQNTTRSKQLVAAQARLYSDAKTIHNARLLLVFVFATMTICCALFFPAARSYIGASSGVGLLAVALFVTGVEKRRRLEAAAIQEEFDTGVFQLPWNRMQAERPSNVTISWAAKRYNDGREENWYSDTLGTHRPFDVLICQMTNLGWGASMHRLWARLLSGALVLLVGAVVVITLVLHLSFLDSFLALMVPALAPAKELIDLMRANFENANSKEATEQQIIGIWKEGLQGKAVPMDTCRLIQDRILHYRQSNAYVPDWLDLLRRDKNEAAMNSIAAIMIEEAKSSGYA
jgi:hypothetical protein